VDKIAMTLQAESESAACALAFSIMELDASLGVCVAEVIDRRQAVRALSLKSYHVTILLSAVTVDAPALEAALEKLADEGVTTMTTQIDPAAALEASVPDDSLESLEPLLETFEAEARGDRRGGEGGGEDPGDANHPGESFRDDADGGAFQPPPRASGAARVGDDAAGVCPGARCGGGDAPGGCRRRGRGRGEGVHDGPGGVGGGGVRGGVRDDAARLEPRGVLGGARRGAPAALSFHPSPPDAGGARGGARELPRHDSSARRRGGRHGARVRARAPRRRGRDHDDHRGGPRDGAGGCAGIDEALVEAFEEEVEAAAPAKPSATATITEADSAAGPAAGPAVAPPLPPPAPLASETTLLAAVAEAALDEKDGELILAEATIMADAIASGRASTRSR